MSRNDDVYEVNLYSDDVYEVNMYSDDVYEVNLYSDDVYEVILYINDRCLGVKSLCTAPSLLLRLLMSA